MARRSATPTTETTTSDKSPTISEIFGGTSASETAASTTEAASQATQPTDQVTTTDTTPAPETPRDSQPPQPSWVDRLKTDFGFDDIKDENEARERVIQALTQATAERERLMQEREQFRPLVQYGQQYIDQMQKQQAETAAPAQPAVAEDTGPWPNVRQVDQKLVERYYDANLREWKFNAPPDVIRETEAAMAANQEWTNKLVYSPREALEPIIEHVVKARVQDILKEQFGMEPKDLVQKLDIGGEQRYINEVLNQYEGVLFELDPRTKKPDYQRPSVLGQKFSEALQKAENVLKIPTEAARYYYAAEALAPFLSQQNAPAATQAAAQTAEDKRTEHLHRAAARSVPSRDGSVPKSPDSRQRQNPHVSLAREFGDAFFSEGVASP